MLTGGKDASTLVYEKDNIGKSLFQQIVTMARNSMKRSTIRRSGGRNAPGFGNAGDIPRAPKSDLSTSSTRLPKATSQLIFHQHAPPVTITASNVGVVAGNVLFTLNSLEGSATLQTLFDFYRIRGVRATIRPQNIAVGLVDPTVTKLVEFYWVLDYNDNSPLATAAVAREYDNCVILYPGETANRTFQPKMSATVRSAGGTDYMSVNPQWLNTSSDDILHYGMKYLVPQVNAGQAVVQTWQLDIEYYIEFSKVVG